MVETQCPVDQLLIKCWLRINQDGDQALINTLIGGIMQGIDWYSITDAFTTHDLYYKTPSQKVC